jgi:antitoxin component of RelBE/YafQ-DinJ toxin-antitoxin module
MEKTESIRIRLEAEEKKAFQQAADLSGLGLSTWARERLRRSAIKELEEAAIPIKFLLPIEREET